MVTPPVLLLDVTRRCNAQCPICGRRFWTEKPPSDMSRELAFRLIELPYVEKVCFGQYGEPTLWPHLVGAVRHASDRRRYTWLTTNGGLLVRPLSWSLFDAGLDKLIVSIDAIDPEVYDRLRPPLNWYRVLENLDGAIAIRDTGFSTRIVVNCVRCGENRGRSDAEIRAFFKSRGVDGVAITPEIDVSPHPGCSDGSPIECERPQKHLTVRSDGELMLCCRDCHSAVDGLGSVAERDPLEVYNDAPFRAVRSALASGTGVPDICRGCRAHWADVRPVKRAP